MRQTEGRVPVFSHEVVPDHLRTKPDPEVEEQEKQLTTDAACIGADAAQKQIQSLNKMCSNLLRKLAKRSENQRVEVSGQTSRHLTLQTPMLWWQLLPLGRGCLIGDLQAAVVLASRVSQELGPSLQEPRDYSRCRWQELQASSSQCSVGCRWLKQVNQGKCQVE